MLIFVENLEKNPWSKARTNNKLNSHMTLGQNRTRATLVEGEHSHHCAIPAPQFIYTKPLVQLVSQSVRYMVKSFTYLNIWSVFLSHLYRRIRINVTNLDSSKSFFKKKTTQKTILSDYLLNTFAPTRTTTAATLNIKTGTHCRINLLTSTTFNSSQKYPDTKIPGIFPDLENQSLVNHVNCCSQCQW